MSEPKFTKGPWWIAETLTILAGEDVWIGKANWRNGKANAHLIAAAPDLYETAQKASCRLSEPKSMSMFLTEADMLSSLLRERREVASALRAALSRARGETPNQEPSE